jgi:glycosyl transferase family 25
MDTLIYMRVFIISLESELERRHKIGLQCKEQSLFCEFINAVDGRKLPSEIATTVTHDFYNSKLTRGEIGCALSHLNIYSKMVSENISHALVLEDDAIFDGSLHDCLSGVDGIIREDKPEIFVLTARCSYNKHIKKTDFSGRNYFRITNGSGGYGYVINLAAAKLLLERNLPIKFEADRWTIFRDIAGLYVWCTKDPVIRHACIIDDKSTIGNERNELAEERGQVINKLKRTIPFYQLKRIKNILLNKSGIVN